MKRYSIEQVTALLEEAVEKAEQSIFAGLYGADHEQRFALLDQLDAIGGVHRQLRIILEHEEETS